MGGEKGDGTGERMESDTCEGGEIGRGKKARDNGVTFEKMKIIGVIFIFFKV